MIYGPLLLSSIGVSKDKSDIPFILMGESLLILLGTLLGQKMIDKYGSRYLLVTFLPLYALAYFCMALSFALPAGHQPFAAFLCQLSQLSALTIVFAAIYFPANKLPSEIFPVDLKSKAGMFSQIFGKMAGYIVAMAYLYAHQTDKGRIMYLIFTGIINLVFWCFVVLNFKETKGKTLEECVGLYLEQEKSDKVETEE